MAALLLCWLAGCGGSSRQQRSDDAQQEVEDTRGMIAFISDRDGDSEIFKMRTDGTAVTRLTNNTESDGSPAWTSDGSKITFVRVWLTAEGEPKIFLFRMSADGSDHVQLPIELTNRDHDFNPSPDGSKIAFVRDLPVGEYKTRSKIFLINADGGDQVQLSSGTTYERNPDWSPDGSKIVFVGIGTSGTEDIYTVNVDGTGLTQLTGNDPYTWGTPEWSPAGSKILLSAYNGSTGGTYDVFVMNADGSGLKNLTNQPDFHDMEADWSPDGKEIVFVRSRDGDCTEGLRNRPVYTPDPREEDREPPPFRQEETCDIWRMRAEGSSPTRITSNPANDDSPAWQPLTGAGTGNR
jgi:TolB protein